MIKVNILYPDNPDGHFDLDYYLNTHMPMSIEKLGPTLRAVSIEHGISGAMPGTRPAYIVMCNFTFDSIDAFLAAFTPHADWLQGDIPNYTNVEPVIQFSEIKLSR